MPKLCSKKDEERRVPNERPNIIGTALLLVVVFVGSSLVERSRMSPLATGELDITRSSEQPTGQRAT